MQTSANPSCPLPGMEQHFSLDNLTTKDRRVLCEYVYGNFPILRISKEDFDQLSDIQRLLRQMDLTPEQLWLHMNNVTSVDLMIAAAALRCVRRLPDDPRLDPQPHAPAPVKLPRTPEERARVKREQTKAPVSATGEYLASVAPNPKRKGSASWDRYALYRVGMTRAQLRAAGLSTADFRYDTEHEYISWSEEQPTSFDPGQKLTNDASAIVTDEARLTFKQETLFGDSPASGDNSDD